MIFSPNDPLVAIVMATYQGEKFIAQQLRSFTTQTYRNWILYVSDDGSTDGTHRHIAEFSAEVGDERVIVSDGPRKGFAANFMSGLSMAASSDYYAFSDQDDIWEPKKIEQALTALKSMPEGRPALYCSRTRITDVRGTPMFLSPGLFRHPSFRNALVENIGSGNTMVMNRIARDLLCSTPAETPVDFHDWWAYQLITGAGGFVYFDHDSKILYRQHENNQIGQNDSWKDRLRRIRLLFRGNFSKRTDCNVRALNAMRHVLTPENCKVLDVFIEMKAPILLRRLMAFRKSGIHRQTVLGNIGLITATVFHKI